MKILYLPIINEPALHSPAAGDYLCDTIFHGLRSVLGEDVVDAHRLWHLYKKDLDEEPEKFKKLWGKGFTTYGLLPDLDVDRNDILNNIFSNFCIGK